MAAHNLDPKFRGSQVILLVSDGDDPANDGEWKSGADDARGAGIPVFVIGVGDPTQPSTIRIGGTLLTFGNQPVETPAGQAFLVGLSQTMGPPRWCGRIRNHRHDLTRHHRDSSVERPHAAQFMKIGDTRGLNPCPRVQLSPMP